MNPKRILIVDDDKDLSDILAARCRKLGLEVETAQNVLTAVRLLSTRLPDLICLDVEMPTGNGLSVCEYLNHDPKTANIPVVILTGRKDRDTVKRCGTLRAYYVHKSPDLWPSLRPVLCELLDFQPNDGNEPIRTGAARRTS